MVTTSETQNISINVQFTRDRSTWLALGAAGGLLVAAVLAAVTLGVAWGTYDFSVASSGSPAGGFSNEGEADYKLFEVSSDGGSTKYTDSSMDEADGIGLVRAAGPLAVTGVVLGFVAMLVTAASVFVHAFRLRLVGAITATLAAAFVVLALVLFPIGVSDMHEAGTQNFGGGMTFTASALSWGAGLFLAIIAAVAALGATAANFLSMRQASA